MGGRRFRRGRKGGGVIIAEKEEQCRGKGDETSDKHESGWDKDGVGRGRRREAAI